MAGLCLGQEGAHMRLLCPDGSELRLSTGRVVHASREAVDLSDPMEKLLSVLRDNIILQSELVSRVDPGSLWEAAGSQGGYCEIPALARSAFGAAAATAHEAAVLSALVSDHVYFKLHDRMFLAHTPEQVAANRQKKLRSQERQRFISHGTVWLQAALAGRERPEEDGAACIELLKDYAAFGKESPGWSDFREIFHAAGINDQRQCFDLLVRLGAFGPDENLLLRRHGIAHEWPPEVLEQVERIGAGAICAAVNDPGRQDLTAQYACAIDESFTRDVDDAISFRFDGQSLELGIHITDVSAFVPGGSPLDDEAARRGASLYMPEAKIPMLPPALSENIASFRVGERNPAISFIARISPAGEILEYRILRSVVRIAERLTYSDADEAIAGGSDMARLHRYALAMRERRINAGGLYFLIPELQVRVDRSHEVTLKLRDRETPGQILIAECMILANYCAATYFEENRHPGLFRRQAEPLRRIIGSDAPNLFSMYLQRRFLSRAEISTAPGPHSSLGLRSYTSITSPLRKYIDLVMQRQLVSLLQGGPAAYTRRQLHEISSALQPVLTRLALVEYERWRYWILKALQGRPCRRVSALVLDRNNGMYELLLNDFMLNVQVKEQDAGALVPGAMIDVLLEKADPFTGSIQVRVAELKKTAEDA